MGSTLLFINVIVWIVNAVLGLYSFTIIVRVIMSWVRADPTNKFVLFVFRITEPILEPVREFIMEKLGLNLGGLDLAPMVILLAIWALRQIIEWGAIALITQLTAGG